MVPRDARRTAKGDGRGPFTVTIATCFTRGHRRRGKVARFLEPPHVTAHRGVDTPRFGRMKPSGLTDPAQAPPVADAVRTQLRQGQPSRGGHLQPRGLSDPAQSGGNADGSQLLAVGVRAVRMILTATLNPDAAGHGGTRAAGVRGQVSGVEGYVESASSGGCGWCNAARMPLGLSPNAPPRTTAIGAVARRLHVDPCITSRRTSRSLSDRQAKGPRRRLPCALLHGPTRPWRAAMSPRRQGLRRAQPPVSGSVVSIAIRRTPCARASHGRC